MILGCGAIPKVYVCSHNSTVNIFSEGIFVEDRLGQLK
jgi:hypothetical protein